MIDTRRRQSNPLAEDIRSLFGGRVTDSEEGQ